MGTKKPYKWSDPLAASASLKLTACFNGKPSMLLNIKWCSYAPWYILHIDVVPNKLRDIF